jgi:hypothetical protein
MKSPAQRCCVLICIVGALAWSPIASGVSLPTFYISQPGGEAWAVPVSNFIAAPESANEQFTSVLPDEDTFAAPMLPHNSVVFTCIAQSSLGWFHDANSRRIYCESNEARDEDMCDHDRPMIRPRMLSLLA